MLSKMAKFRIQNAKKSQLKAISDAVDLMASMDLITIKRATVIDRYLSTHGGRKNR